MPSFVAGGIGVNGRHMAENHIFLILRHFKIFFCIVHRSSRMGETVKALSGHLSVSMPVIEKQIVKETGSRRLPAVPSHPPAYAVSQIRYPDAVIPARRLTMLNVTFHRLKHRMLQNVHHIAQIFLIPRIPPESGPAGIFQPFFQLTPFLGSQQILFSDQIPHLISILHQKFHLTSDDRESLISDQPVVKLLILHCGSMPGEVCAHRTVNNLVPLSLLVVVDVFCIANGVKHLMRIVV